MIRFIPNLLKPFNGYLFENKKDTKYPIRIKNIALKQVVFFIPILKKINLLIFNLPTIFYYD